MKPGGGCIFMHGDYPAPAYWVHAPDCKGHPKRAPRLTADIKGEAEWCLSEAPRPATEEDKRDDHRR